MKNLIISILFIVTCNAHSQSNHEAERIRELLNIMDMDSMVESMYSQMEIMMQNMSTEFGVKGDEQAIFDEYFSRMVLIMREDMSWEKMEPKVAQIYSDNFSQKEISDMLDFYKTETGQSVINKLPIVMQQSFEMSQEFVNIMLPKIQEISQEFKADLDKHREKM